MPLLRETLYQPPDREERVKAEQLWENRDVSFLLVAPDGYNLEVVVAREINHDGIFHRAESYWLDYEGDLTLSFWIQVFKGYNIYQ